MKKRLTLYTIAFAILSIVCASIHTSTLSAQTAVTISKEKVRVNGKLMYAHQVIKGQTIYSICKAYNVTAEELQDSNPAIANGLKEGMLLVIPVKDASVANSAPRKEKTPAKIKDNEKQTNAATKSSEKQKTAAEVWAERSAEGRDVVKEGAAAIAAKAKQVGNKIAGLFKSTSEDAKEVVDNTRTKIAKAIEPKAAQIEEEIADNKEVAKEAAAEYKKEIEEKAEEVVQKGNEVRENIGKLSESIVKEGDTYTTHNIKWYEDMDEIATQYSINKDLIKYYNSLPSDDLDKVQSLKIPTGKTLERVKSEYIKSLYSKPSNDNQSSVSDTPAASAEKKKLILPHDDSSEKEIAIILPLHSNHKISSTYMDFYSGVLLAAQNLKEKNYKFNIIDQSDFSDTETLIKKNNLEGADALVGPIKSSNIKEYLSLINENSIPLISPLDPSADSLLAKSNFLFQLPASKDIRERAFVNWISEIYDANQENSITVIWEEGSKDASEAKRVMNQMEELGLHYSTISFPVTKAVQIAPTFKKNFNGKNSNIVVVLSNSEGFVAEALRNIDALELQPDAVTLFGTSKWRNFETIDLNLFYNYNLHLVLSYYIDLTEKDVQDFILKYRELYNAEPSANAFCGYDVITSYIPIVFMLKQSIANDQPIDYYITQKALQQYYVVDKAELAENGENEAEGGYKNYGATGVIYHHNYTVSATPLNAIR